MSKALPHKKKNHGKTGHGVSKATEENDPISLSFNGNDILNLQRQIGNQSVVSLLQGPRHIQRQPTDSDSEAEEEPFETSGFGLQGRMTGHGFTPTPNRAARSGDPLPNTIANPLIQRQGGNGVTVNATFTSNAPTITRAPAESIAAGHGRPNVAGWTTPRYNFQVPFANPSRIDFSVTMDYDMELASEYTGDTLSVLQDHEMGHVNIGKDKGKTHLVDDLKSQYEGQSALTRAGIVSARNNAAMLFQNEEGVASEDYDSADYPRMQQAYLGARTPLADLEAKSPAILQASSSLRAFSGAAAGVGQGIMRGLALGVMNSAAALSADDRSQLQYNPEFKALVSQAQQIITDYIEAHHFDFFLMDFNMLAEETMSVLENLRTVLAGFTWQAPS